MNDEKETTLREWTAPRLMRLNQAAGTDKHLLGAESVVYGTGWIIGTGPYAGQCELTNTIASAGGGVAVPCGPS